MNAKASPRPDATPLCWAVGQWTLCTPAGPLTRDGEAAALGSRAIDLLALLVRRPGEVVPNDELMAHAWSGRVVEEGNLYLHIAALRKLLGRDAIRSIYGRGYQLTLPVKALCAVAVADAPGRESSPVGRSEAADLFGREDDLAALPHALSRHRVVTLAGPAGVGKSHLAAVLLHAWEGGSLRLDLASLHLSTPVRTALAVALGLDPAEEGPTPDDVLGVLRSKPQLLVLDNAEHRIGEVADLVTMLSMRCPGLHVLVTSQVPMALREEQVFRLRALELPTAAAGPNEALDSPAVAMFCARVAAQDRSFAASGSALLEVVAICRRLDGLPLALELAASRVPLLGLSDVRERLDDGLDLLRHPALAPGVRHRSLAQALADAFALLSTDQQRVLRRLSVLRGGFTPALALHALAENGDAGPAAARWDPLDTLDVLEVLRARSWLTETPGHGEPRHRLLQPLRAFAAERLGEAGETDAMRQQLARSLCAWFEARDRPGSAPARAALLTRWIDELDNLRAALEGLHHQVEQADLHVSLAGASAWIWVQAGLHEEGVQRCKAAMARVTAGTPKGLVARLRWGLNALSGDCSSSVADTGGPPALRQR